MRAVLEDKATEVDASSVDFWVMVAALKVSRNVPCSGHLLCQAFAMAGSCRGHSDLLKSIT